MRRSLLVLSIAAVAALLVRCGLQDPRNVSSGGHLTVTTSNPSGTNAAGGTFEAKSIAGFYNAGERHPPADGGWSIVTGTPNALDTTTCKGVGIGFAGKPEAGKTWNLVYISGFDGGTGDGGTQNAPYGDYVGSLSYSEGCLGNGKYQTWRSTSGTITFTSVAEPAELPQGATPGANKDVKFTLNNVQVTAESGGSTGTFTLNGDAEIQLFAGMNQ